MSLTTAPCWMLLPLPGLQVLVGSGHMDGCSGEVVDLLPWWQWSEGGWTASVSGGGALPGASWVPGASGRVDRPLPLALYDSHPWAVAPHLRPPSFSCWDERAHIRDVWPQVFGTLGRCEWPRSPGCMSFCLWLLGTGFIAASHHYFQAHFVTKTHT